MRKLVADESHSNKRIDKVLRDCFPKMPVNALYKAFRKKDIKVNSVRVKEDHIINTGDVIEVFIIDSILDGVPAEGGASLNKGFTVVFEDKNLLIVNKSQGIPVHPDRDQASDTLIDLVKSYLAERGEYNPSKPFSFPPALCHRLDRNTGGLVIIAKNPSSLKAIQDKIESREIRKYYQCLVKGKPERTSDELKAFLEKDELKSRVFVKSVKTKNTLQITTRYRVLSYDRDKDVSRLEVELVTGRTHQIRAHLAFIGHPIIGDGKYGTNAINRAFGAKQQALWACRIVFDFREAGILNYLKGREFNVEPEFKIK